MVFGGGLLSDISFAGAAGKPKAPLAKSLSCGSILQGNGISKIKNLTRRVSFPSDDKLISGYNEPKNPWEHGESKSLCRRRENCVWIKIAMLWATRECTLPAVMETY